MRSIAMACLFVLCVASSARAQQPTQQTQSDAAVFSVGGAIDIPFGDWADGVGMGFGVMGGLNKMMGPKFAITGRLGFIYHLPKEILGADLSIIEIPIMGGVKLYPGAPGPNRPYACGELGLNFMRVSASGPGGSDSDTETELSMILGGGYETEKMDFRAGLFISTLDYIDESMSLLVSLSWKLQ